MAVLEKGWVDFASSDAHANIAYGGMKTEPEADILNLFTIASSQNSDKIDGFCEIGLRVAAVSMGQRAGVPYRHCDPV